MTIVCLCVDQADGRVKPERPDDIDVSESLLEANPAAVPPMRQQCSTSLHKEKAHPTLDFCKLGACNAVLCKLGSEISAAQPIPTSYSLPSEHRRRTSDQFRDLGVLFVLLGLA